MDIKTIIILIIALAGIIGHVSYRNGVNDTIAVLEEEVVFKDSKVDTLTGHLIAVQYQVDRWKFIADSLFNNPKVIKELRTITVVDTVNNIVSVHDTVTVSTMAVHTIKYAEDSAIKVSGLHSEEGDTLSFDIWEWIDIGIKMDRKGNVYIDDEMRYQIKNISLSSKTKYLKTTDKVQLFLDGYTLFSLEKKQIGGMVGIGGIFEERYKAGIYGNQEMIGMNFGIKLIGR